MKIGQVATKAEVTIDTVRFYERRGVIPSPQRCPSGYREYTEATVERIRMARALQQLGLTLDEIVDALRAHDAGELTAANHLGRLAAVVDRIDTKIADLRRTRDNLTQAVAECGAGRCRFNQNGHC